MTALGYVPRAYGLLPNTTLNELATIAALRDLSLLSDFEGPAGSDGGIRVFRTEVRIRPPSLQGP